MTRTIKPISLPHHRARELRHDQTDAEKKLWGRLRAKRFDQFRFRRQFPIGNFIADFACPKSKLVIELDGGQHLDQRAKDDWHQTNRAARLSSCTLLGQRRSNRH